MWRVCVGGWWLCFVVWSMLSMWVCCAHHAVRHRAERNPEHTIKDQSLERSMVTHAMYPNTSCHEHALPWVSYRAAARAAQSELLFTHRGVTAALPRLHQRVQVDHFVVIYPPHLD